MSATRGRLAQLAVAGDQSRDPAGYREDLERARRDKEDAELALALRHWERGKVGPGAVATEIADVEIMLEQLRLMVPRVALGLARKQQRAKLRRAISGKAEQ